MDKVAQAISWQVALHHGAFTSYDPVKSTPPTFDWEQIKRDVDGLVRMHAIIDQFFCMNGIVPFVVIYESLIRNPLEAGRLLCEWLGAGHLNCAPERIGLSEQKTGLNAEWKKKFVEQCQGEFADHVIAAHGWPKAFLS